MKALVIMILIALSHIGPCEVRAESARNAPVFISLNLDNSGSPQQVSSASAVLWVGYIEFHAPDANSGNIYIADSSANATSTAGLTLAPGETYRMQGNLLPSGRRATIKAQNYYWGGATSGDDLVYIYHE